EVAPHLLLAAKLCGLDSSHPAVSFVNSGKKVVTGIHYLLRWPGPGGMCYNGSNPDGSFDY
ncbi:hypothetical protein, partial [Paenibacillus ihuae]|uniref:hypothetical protein n=1 Tax=Paenibacillus ihuae TaxID=1232431 RepID=UPI001AE010F2